MSRLGSSSTSTDHHAASRTARLADVPLTQWRSVVDATTTTTTPVDGGTADRRPSPTTWLELDACCRRNIVTDRTRFFEERSRRPPAAAAAAVPPRRRSRSAAPRLSRAADPSHAAGTTHVAATRRPVQSTFFNGQSVPASIATVSAASLLPVNNETDALKVFTDLYKSTQAGNFRKFFAFVF